MAVGITIWNGFPEPCLMLTDTLSLRRKRPISNAHNYGMASNSMSLAVYPAFSAMSRWLMVCECLSHTENDRGRSWPRKDRFSFFPLIPSPATHERHPCARGFGLPFPRMPNLKTAPARSTPLLHPLITRGSPPLDFQGKVHRERGVEEIALFGCAYTNRRNRTGPASPGVPVLSGKHGRMKSYAAETRRLGPDQ